MSLTSREIRNNQRIEAVFPFESGAWEIVSHTAELLYLTAVEEVEFQSILWNNGMRTLDLIRRGCQQEEIRKRFHPIVLDVLVEQLQRLSQSGCKKAMDLQAAKGPKKELQATTLNVAVSAPPRERHNAFTVCRLGELARIEPYREELLSEEKGKTAIQAAKETGHPHYSWEVVPKLGDSSWQDTAQCPKSSA